MASFVKLDPTNLVQYGYNSTWKYSFPGSAADFKDVACAVQSISITIADGIYAYAGINRTIQTALVNAGAYLIDASGNNVFYLQLSENSVYYAAQFDFSATPTSLPAGYTRQAAGLYSAGGTGLPTTTRVPRLIIDNAYFGKVVGLTTGTYPSAPATVASAQLSNIIPQIQPSSSYVVRCDLIKNEYVALGDILSVVMPLWVN
ncbi:unnamed protein product [Phytophthora lilii]|uniref:Unnamed protein product n=1 Tax=Phytophthora lilii TaxID=2077276 RepID=A0A9W6UDX0_9STRA|nr:unnamed protein product [Phytophthora lilii]